MSTKFGRFAALSLGVDEADLALPWTFSVLPFNTTRFKYIITNSSDDMIANGDVYNEAALGGIALAFALSTEEGDLIFEGLPDKVETLVRATRML